MNEMHGSPKPLVVGIGEVLWDMFPDGPCLGGAPANFACSVAGLASETVQSSVVSAVGRDDLGGRALDALGQRGVDPSCIAQCDLPTGQVMVRLDDSRLPSYEIATEAAWDHLVWSDKLALQARRADAVCYGTLGQRSAGAGAVIEQFIRSTRPDCLRIMDVNLRPPYWTDSLVLDSLSWANILKCNDTELPVIASLLQLSGSDVSVVGQLVDRYSLRLAAVTRGANGSLLVNGAGVVSEVPGTPVSVADTVGAGDAFAAALAVATLRGLPTKVMHTWATRVAAYVCSQTGATPAIPRELQL